MVRDESGLIWEPFTPSQDDLNFIAYMNWLSGEMTHVYGVPPQLIGDIESVENMQETIETTEAETKMEDFGAAMTRLVTSAGETSESLADVSAGIMRLAEPEYTTQSATGRLSLDAWNALEDPKAEEKKPAEKPKPNHAARRGLRLYMRRADAKAGRRDRVVTTCASCHLPFLAPASGRCQCKTDRPMRRAEVA